jgi:hypothetical protein
VSNEQESMAEVLQAINQFASNIETRFLEIEKRFDFLEKEVGHLKVNMVTKSYLDDKFADFGIKFRKFNFKFIEILYNKNVLTLTEANELRQLS